MPKRNLRLLRFARSNRAHPTSAEDILWWELRNSHLGYRFRRQEPIGPYIVDFVCKAQRLVVEVDGDTHVDDEADHRRDQHLQALGYRVIRFANSEIYEHHDESVDWLWHQLHPNEVD
jgi:guanylate kinase